MAIHGFPIDFRRISNGVVLTVPPVSLNLKNLLARNHLRACLAHEVHLCCASGALLAAHDCLFLASLPQNNVPDATAYLGNLRTMHCDPPAIANIQVDLLGCCTDDGFPNDFIDFA